MTLIIHGFASDKYFKKQRIDESRLEPIRVPFEEVVTKEFIDVSPEDAWLPLSLALLERLHRLRMVVCGGSHVAERVNGDEYLYQVMRTSLFNVLGHSIYVMGTREIVSEKLPIRLPTSGELLQFGYQEKYDAENDYEIMHQALISDAVELEITPDTRTVEDALKSFDAQLSRIALTHFQNMFIRAEDLELTDREIEQLRGSIRTEQRKLRNGIPQYLAMAIEVLDRIDLIWATLYSDIRSLHRFKGDELAYQGYIQLLFRSLSSFEYREVSSLAHDLIPRLLPSNDELVSSNPLLKEVPARIERLHYELIALATQLGEPAVIDYANEPDLDSLFEEELRNWEIVSRLVSDFRENRGEMRHNTVVQFGPNRRGRGRPASTVTYEIAAEVWWKLHTEFENKPPTQIEIAEHIQSLGYAFSERTLRNKITEWTAKNLKWPPPKDWSKAA